MSVAWWISWLILSARCCPDIFQEHKWYLVPVGRDQAFWTLYNWCLWRFHWMSVSCGFPSCSQTGTDTKWPVVPVSSSMVNFFPWIVTSTSNLDEMALIVESGTVLTSTCQMILVFTVFLLWYCFMQHTISRCLNLLQNVHLLFLWGQSGALWSTAFTVDLWWITVDLWWTRWWTFLNLVNRLSFGTVHSFFGYLCCIFYLNCDLNSFCKCQFILLDLE